MVPAGGAQEVWRAAERTRGPPLKERQELEAKVFVARGGKQVARAIRENVPWERAHEFAVGPHAAREALRLVAKFHEFWNRPENSSLPPDAALVKHMWQCLETAQPRTVQDAMDRVVKQLHREGVTGVRTQRFLGARAALKRLSVMARPVQAEPLKLEDVKGAVEALGQKGELAAAAMLALAWVTRSRVPDLRVLTVEDVREVEGAGAADVGVVGLEVWAKEKQARTWRPPIYAPPGALTAVVVAWVRRVQAEGRREVFGAGVAEYERILGLLRGALPAGSWLHGVKRGAAQAVEAATGAGPEEMRQLLRHQNVEVTHRYLNATTAKRRRQEEQLTRALQ